jgi:hypothetical protein
VGRVTAFQIAGLEMVFQSSDHAPPHFHVRKGLSWEIRVFIDTSTKESGLDYTYKFPKLMPRKFRGLSVSEESMLLEQVLLHKEQLLTEWQAKVCIKENI